MARPAEPLMGEDVMHEPHRKIDRDEVAQSIREIHAACFGWALACCRHDREEAEDVLQTSYLKALEGKAVFNGSSSVKTWMFGIVRKTASERRRGNVLRRLLGRTLLGGSDAPPTPEAVTSDREAQARLRRMLGTLSPRQRDLLHLVYYQEMTIEEASEVLGISVGTARTHYERGKQRLRALIHGENQA
jgi:RNA polymerase sigma-70 factor (ECF subfamily)